MANVINNITLVIVCHEPTGKCFLNEGTLMNWNAARTLCQSQGGDLAVMETQELWNFVMDNSVTLG